MRVLWSALALTLTVAAASDDADSEGTCEAGLWGQLLEEWATTPVDHGGRHGRVMSLPPTKGYYVTDRVDGPLIPPPPPPHMGPHGPHPPSHGPHHGPHGPHHGAHGPPPGPHGPHGPQPGSQGPHPHNHPPHPPPQGSYEEWQASPPPPTSKIVNRPPNPYKDQFKPSPAYPAPPSPSNQPIPVSSQQWADRVDAPPPPPQKQVSETDLYLLSAIEKLVYRVDLMEKRLRKVEETMHYLVAGKETKPEPCSGEFTRVGGGCYYVSPEAGDWKAASLRCRKLRAHLLEIDDDGEKRTFFSALLGDSKLKGTDFWTGGLNPGLLWIWSHSAKPLATNASANATVVGEGRCLALVHDPAVSTYVYRGQDCAVRHKFVCELPEDKAKLSNEIERVARELRTTGGLVAATARKAKIMWTATALDSDTH